ncbi:MAG TPA: phasin family protein [Sphingomonas sp.]|jgi:phasin family protein|nr:phasin family protein [Sphingomonas sp.]
MTDVAAKPKTSDKSSAKSAAAAVDVATSAAAAKLAQVVKSPAAIPPALAATPASTKSVAAAKPVVKPAAQAKFKPVVPAPKPVVEKPAATTAPAPVEIQTPVAASATPSAPSATPTAPSAISAAKDVTMDTITSMTDKAQAMFSTDHAKGAMEKSQKMFDEMNSFSKGNIEALVESSKIAAKGIETLGQDAAAYAKKSFEEASAAVKTMASVKSPTEFMKLQSDYVRSAFDMMVAETSRSTEAMLKLAGEVAQPISNRVAIAAEKVKIAA